MKSLLGVAALVWAGHAFAADIVLNCNDGAAIITKDGDMLTGYIYDTAAVAAFVHASETVSDVRDSAGHVYHIKKSFPPGMVLKDSFLEIQNLLSTVDGDTYCNGNAVGACFSAYETGFDFVAVGGGTMPSQDLAIWFINRWWFDRCVRN